MLLLEKLDKRMNQVRYILNVSCIRSSDFDDLLSASNEMASCQNPDDTLLSISHCLKAGVILFLAHLKILLFWRITKFSLYINLTELKLNFDLKSHI